MALVVDNSPSNARYARQAGSIPGSRRSPEVGNGNPLQYSCLENSMDNGASRGIVHGVAKSQTQLSTHGGRGAISVQCSVVSDSVSQTARTAACKASLSITSSRSLIKFMSTESVMPSNHLILCCPLLLPPSIFPSIRVFSKESVLHIR